MDMLIFGLSVTVVGMLIVFFGLIILIGLIKLVTVMTSGEKHHKETATPAPAPAPVPVAPVEPAPVAAPQDDALIAVICAGFPMPRPGRRLGARNRFTAASKERKSF